MGESSQLQKDKRWQKKGETGTKIEVSKRWKNNSYVKCSLWSHKRYALIKDSDDPIWPNRYKASDDSWGHHHCNEFKNKYGLPSHDLRRFGITALINEGVSPYRIWDVVRHKIPGMSEVTMMYNRPTTQDLIEAMEVIAK